MDGVRACARWCLLCARVLRLMCVPTWVLALAWAHVPSKSRSFDGHAGRSKSQTFEARPRPAEKRSYDWHRRTSRQSLGLSAGVLVA